MVITMVVDNYGFKSNGTTISIKQCADALRNAGHTVRIVGAVPTEKDKDAEIVSDENVFAVKQRDIFVVSWFAKPQGFIFGMPDEEILRKALNGADVCHIATPFKLGKTAIRIAKEMNVPSTCAFHIQAENFTYNIGVGKSKFANRFVYKFLNKKFYKYVDRVHCPSKFIADELVSNDYNNKMHIVSNGVKKCFLKQQIEKPAELKDKFVILFTGRFSPEKRHDLLIKAVKRSKYADRIQLIFAGKGPKLEKIMKLGDELINPPIFGFYPTEKLIEIINYADLYVHPADIEIEAIACVEAFACGLVPLISDSPKSATKQFALSEQNIFFNGNSYDLSRKIDFWIEHPKLKQKMSEKYVEYAKQFNVNLTVSGLVDMFNLAIEDTKTHFKTES